MNAIAAVQTARDVMNAEVWAVRAEMTVAGLATAFAERQISGAPVVDRDGQLVGVVSVTDIAQRDASGAAASELVRDIMTPTVFTVPESTPVPRIAQTMIAGRIHRLFVTRQGRMVGIVTALDLLRLLYQGDATRGTAPRPAGERSRGPRPKGPAKLRRTRPRQRRSG